MGVKAALRERARQAGGQPVAQHRQLRVDHDLDTRTTDAAHPKRTTKRGRRDEKLKRSPLEMPEIVILNESPTMRRGW